MVTAAVTLLPAVAVAIGRSSCSFISDGSDTPPWSPATVTFSPCSRVVRGSVKVSTAGVIGCSLVLYVVLEGSRAYID